MTDEGLGDRVNWQRRHSLRQMWLEQQWSSHYLGQVRLPLDQLHSLLQGQDAFDHLSMGLGEARRSRRTHVGLWTLRWIAISLIPKQRFGLGHALLALFINILQRLDTAL